MGAQYSEPADTLTPEKRSKIMSHVRGKDTKPELAVRRLVHALGYRYRLHSRDLPGKPDLVFKSRKKIIFVHGCFWHWHEGCPNCRLPKSKLDFWMPKLAGNRKRDHITQERLRELGWDVITIWECELSNLQEVTTRVITFLEE